jgi:hypothetical protein
VPAAFTPNLIGEALAELESCSADLTMVFLSQFHGEVDKIDLNVPHIYAWKAARLYFVGMGLGRARLRSPFVVPSNLLIRKDGVDTGAWGGGEAAAAGGLTGIVGGAGGQGMSIYLTKAGLVKLLTGTCVTQVAGTTIVVLTGGAALALSVPLMIKAGRAAGRLKAGAWRKAYKLVTTFDTAGFAL